MSENNKITCSFTGKTDKDLPFSYIEPGKGLCVGPLPGRKEDFCRLSFLAFNTGA